MSYADMIRRHLRESSSYQSMRDIALRAAGLRGKALDVASYIINKSDNGADLSVAQVADAVGVSPNTVRRAFSSLGISDVAVAESSVQYGVGDDTGPAHLDSAVRLISHVYDTVHELQGQGAALQQAAALLHGAPFIQVYGTVLSAGVGSMFHEKLSSLGLLCRFTSDTDATLRALPQMVPNGVLFCVSLLGATSHMGIRVLTAAKRLGVRTIVVTNYRSSQAAELANVVLTSGIADPQLHYMDLLARSSQLLLLDVLAEKVACVQNEGTEHGEVS